jgi:hypothetical protein
MESKNLSITVPCTQGNYKIIMDNMKGKKEGGGREGRKGRKDFIKIVQ